MATHNHLWCLPPAQLTLADDEVHVWRAALDLPSGQVQYLRGSLTADELGRAERFHSEKGRQQFIAGRGILRTILSRYLAIAPGHHRFCYNQDGKPLLAPEFDHYRLNFNLAHSNGLALYAIARGREIGIDLEQIRTNFECEEIAERFFSPVEVAILRTISAEMKAEAFFNCWTRKEAYIKAQGEGLSLPLHSFDVSYAPGEPARVLATRDDPQEAARWTLQELIPGDGYVGALAVEGCDWRHKCWQWV
jgi:4'-phosphopantetheinyl transferase